MEPGRLALWGPHEENWGLRADAFALGEFSSRVSGVWVVLGLQVKADANSLIGSLLPGSWDTPFSQLWAAVGDRRGSS